MAKKKVPQMPVVFGAAPAAVKPKKEPEASPPANEGADYDKLVPLRIKEASDAKIRCLIVWADYCYWVKSKPIMHDYTFDALVREYQDRRPDDVEFMDKLGMWGTA